MLCLYTAHIRSVVEYGFEAYAFGSAQVLQKLNRVQSEALRICSGAMRSTPVCALQVECQDMPFHLLHLFRCLSYRCRLLSFYEHPALPLLCGSWHEYLPENLVFTTFNRLTRANIFQHFEVEKIPVLTIPPWLARRPKVSLDLLHQLSRQMGPDVMGQICKDFIESSFTGFRKVYTDGSKSAEGVGCGFIVEGTHPGRGFSLNQFHSAYSAELAALLRVLEYIIKVPVPRTVILSDRTGALQAIKNFDSSCNPIVINIIEKLNGLDTPLNVVFAWIPAHIGIDGNELADTLARNSSKVGKSVNIGLSVTEAKCVMHSVWNKWNNEFVNAGTGGHYRRFAMGRSLMQGCEEQRIAFNLESTLTSADILPFLINFLECIGRFP